MKTIWMGIHPQSDSTRIVAMAGSEQTILKARLLPSPSSRLALPSLLEAVALWQGVPVRAVLVADGKGNSCDMSRYHECLSDLQSALYTLDYVEALRRPRRRDDIDGMGGFADLRQLALFEGGR